MSKPSCSVADCDNKIMAIGLCSKHYSRWHRYGDLNANNNLAKPKPPCEISGCEKISDKKSLCHAHYYQMRRYGQEHRAKTTPGAHAKFIQDNAKHAGNDCLLWPFKSKTHGYGMMRINGKTVGAHRRMCIIAHGEAPFFNAEVAHSCNNRACVNPQHLRWATAAENASDKEIHGTHPRGESVYNAKLTEARVRHIRRSDLSNQEIAKRFGCSRQVVQKARTAKTWTHVR
jgi:hypothetical protein